MLHAIPKSDANRIQSAQVITSVLDAAKELLENAIDAGARKISLRFTNYGLDVLEVIDDGSGVTEKDFDGLVAKHATSKLSDFDDLNRLTTLGFRGEALSALCNLSTLSIVTCEKNTYPMGYALEYDHDGNLKSKKRVSAQIGTSIRLENLFSTLPVRRKDFEKNAKRDLIKTSKLLQSYGAINTSIRLEVMHFSGPSNKNKTHLLGTSGTTGGGSLKQSLSEIFGARLAKTLLPLSSDLVLQSASSAQDREKTITLEGYLSHPQKEYGGQPERQLIYINSRPCQLPQVCRAINDLYSSLGGNRTPFVLLNLRMPPDSYDVNVSPDKRTIFLHDEGLVLDHLRKVIDDMFSNETRHIPTSSIQFAQPETDNTSASVLTRFSLNSQKDDRPSSVTRETFVDVGLEISEEETEERSQATLSSFTTRRIGISEQPTDETPMPSTSTSEPNSLSSHGFQERSPKTEAPGKRSPLKRKRSIVETHRDISSAPLLPTRQRKITGARYHTISDSEDSEDALNDDSNHGEDTTREEEKISSTLVNQAPLESKAKPPGSSAKPLQRFLPRLNGLDHSLPAQQVHTLRIVMKTDKVELHPQKPPAKDILSTGTTEDLSQAGVDNQASTAEETLTLNIAKSDFFGMDIIGQFNLGFILVLRRQEMFIVDQHASDEKSNYERLVRETIIQSQKMALPKELQLSSIERLSIGEHLGTLSKNGFEVAKVTDTDEHEKFLLTSLPVSRNIAFGVSDLLEILHLLIDGAPPSSVRCVKARRMFASRACRSSIMIGTALSKERMQAIIWHLGELDAPWNCPHGRPTMRHLTRITAMPSWTADCD